MPGPLLVTQETRLPREAWREARWVRREAKEATASGCPGCWSARSRRLCWGGPSLSLCSHCAAFAAICWLLGQHAKRAQGFMAMRPLEGLAEDSLLPQSSPAAGRILPFFLPVFLCSGLLPVH